MVETEAILLPFSLSSEVSLLIGVLNKIYTVLVTGANLPRPVCFSRILMYFTSKKFLDIR
jgi:hypothetical protein